MKAVTFLIFIFLLSWASYSSAQLPPNLTKLKTLGEKVEAWRSYCNELISYTGEGFEPYKKLVTEAKKGIAMVPPDSIRARSMFSLFTGIAYEYIKNYDSATVYLKQSAALARQINKASYEITALSRLDNIYDYSRNTAMRKQTMNRMLEIADTTTDILIKEIATDVLAGYYLDINDYEKSIEFKVKDIALYKKGLTEDSSTFTNLNLGFKLSNIAQLFNEIGQYHKALDYLTEAKPYIGNNALKGIEETYYINFIQSYLGLGKVDSARLYYRMIYKAMAGRDTLYNTLAFANYFFGSYYYEQKVIDSAEHYTSLANISGAKSSDKTAYILSNELSGKIFYARGNYAAAIEKLTEALNNSYEFQQQSFADIHKTLAESYAKLDRWDSAYRHFIIYSNIHDTLMQAATNKNFAEVEGRYQNKEKRQQLLTKNIQLDIIKKQRLWLTGALMLVGLVAILLIFIYRNKKKTANILDDKNKKLSQLNEDLEEANQTKAKLFSIIGHDLRSPINQAHQFLKLQQLNPAALTKEQKEELSNKIQVATGSLLEAIEDLLVWSKTQMATFKISLQQISLLQVTEDCLQLQQLNIDTKKIHIENTIGISESVTTDPYFLQIIIRNLLQNAIKASPENSIIKISTERQSGKLALLISNQGNLFTQEDFITAVENKNNTPLSGLGLKLVNELSLKTGIEIVFSNPLQDRTVVHILLPL